MKSFKCEIAYDGTDFLGWQCQQNGKSIQGTMMKTFFKTFGVDVFVLGASRTDAGVHANRQIALIKIPNTLNISDDRLFAVWNDSLPKSIIIKSYKIDNLFFPHSNVLEKTYFYNILIDKNPFKSRFSWHSPLTKKIDWNIFEGYLNIFNQKELNFHQFYKVELDVVKNPIMKISSSLKKVEDGYQIVFQGKSFLRHQLRRIIGGGFLLSTSKERYSLAPVVRSLLGQKVDEKFFPVFTAPPQGLILQDIVYKKL